MHSSICVGHPLSFYLFLSLLSSLDHLPLSFFSVVTTSQSPSFCPSICLSLSHPLSCCLPLSLPLCLSLHPSFYAISASTSPWFPSNSFCFRFLSRLSFISSHSPSLLRSTCPHLPHLSIISCYVSFSSSPTSLILRHHLLHNLSLLLSLFNHHPAYIRVDSLPYFLPSCLQFSPLQFSALLCILSLFSPPLLLSPLLSPPRPSFLFCKLLLSHILLLVVISIYVSF